MTIESIKEEITEDKEGELIKLKAEAFDLHIKRDQVNEEINKRLEQLYARINQING